MVKPYDDYIQSMNYFPEKIQCSELKFTLIPVFL